MKCRNFGRERWNSEVVFMPKVIAALAQAWRLLVLLGGFWLCGAAWGQDHIVERAWLEDRQGRLQWPDVEREPTQAFSDVLSRGYGDSVIWVRLTIDPKAQPLPRQDPDRLVLRIRPVYLDDIQVFDPLVPGGLVGAAGDRRHPSEQAIDGLDFLIPLARGETVRHVWVRLASTSTRQIYAQVLNIEQLAQRNYRQQLVYALYIGSIVTFMAWALMYWVFSREPVIGAFALMQAIGLLYALCSLGYLRVFWPLEWPAHWLDRLTTTCSLLAVSAAIVFHILLTREFDLPAWVLRAQKLLLMLEPLKLVLALGLNQATLALHINMAQVLLVPFFFLLSSILARGWRAGQAAKQPPLGRAVVLGFYVFLVCILAVAALPGLAVTGGKEIQLYLVQTHGLVTAFLILLLLQYRIYARNRQQRETAIALERSNLEAQKERAIREEQGQLLAMLTHELKTPLATMQLRLDTKAPGSKEIQQSIRDMTTVIDRCVQATQLDDRQLVAKIEPVDLVKLVNDAVIASGRPERFELELPAQWVVKTDRQLLFLVLNNLMDNACKYSSPDALVGVRLQRAQVPSLGSCAQLEIENLPGQAGWPDPELVFSKYYRSANARRQGGTGLGLFLVRNLMHTLGGSASYVPDNRHVRFRLHLPA